MHSIYLISAISLNNATAGKVLGEIGAVYLLLQGLKKAFPALSGKWMVLLNVALSLCGSALIIPPESFFSTGTLVVVLLAGIQAAGSAGIHGTVQNVAPVALQTVLGQGPKVEAPQVDSVSTAAAPTVKTNAYEDILK
jgi:hypothetical protein